MYFCLRRFESPPSLARKINKMPKPLGIISCLILNLTPDARAKAPGYGRLQITDDETWPTSVQATPDDRTHRCASQVSQPVHTWPTPHKFTLFTGPRRFVLRPFDPKEPFYPHNHQVSVTWIDNGGAWTGKFTETQNHAEHAGDLAATHAPDRIIHLLSSALHDRFNLPWLAMPAQSP